uniref:(California timema) hypothetical protein n=1 Tax=Timema californicum TaxID=61474 RepID=A0A7R9JG41_TIMCA|nr:unnamed protein product [Timema californicum]
MSKYFDLNRQSLKKKDLSSPQASDANISWSFLVEHFQPPWPEWNDADLNLERWDIIKDKLRQGLAKASSMDSKTSSYFEDPQHAAVPLPTSLKVASWKRPSEVFSDETLTLYEDRTEVIDLVTQNGHLMQSELMRWVISGICAVQFIALTDPFPVEGESLTFIPTTGSDPWQPWHLVYSLCKAGKGHVHKPVMNQSGKYVVRLYYLGCWRKLVVDDRVPVDLEGNILLPITTKNELWPIVLCKALLKLACLTWTGNREVVEFSVISCLTGWVQCEESLRKMSKDDVWRFCCSNVSCYKPEEDKYERIIMKSNRGGNTVTVKNNQQRHVSSNKSNGQKSSLSKGSSPINSEESHKGVSQVVLFGATDKRGTFVPDLGPFWSHPFIIYQTRDVPLKGHTPKPPIQLWKRIRWLDWAKRKGLIHSTEPVPELKCLKIVSCFNKWREIVGQEESSNHFNEYVHGNRESIMRQSSYTKKGSELKMELLDDVSSLNILSDTNISLRSKPFKKRTGNQYGARDLTIVEEKESQFTKTLKNVTNHRETSVVSSKNDLSEKIKHKKWKMAKNALVSPIKTVFEGSIDDLRKVHLENSISTAEEIKSKYIKLNLNKHFSQRSKLQADIDEQTIWADFHRLITFMNKMLLFYKPSHFPFCVKVTDLQFNSFPTKFKGDIKMSKDYKTNLNTLFRVPLTLQKSRNDGFYIFIDSTEKIQMVISLTILPKLAIQMKNLKHKSIITSYSNEEFEMQRSRKPMLSACITVEKYSWNDFKINEPINFIKTFGMKSIMVDMEEGRNVLRVWVRSESAYVAHFMSNFPLFVCHREHLWNVLQRDCEKIHRFGTEVSVKFLALIQQFGRDEYAKARSELYQVINTLTTTPTSRPRLHVAFFNEMLKVIKTYITSNDELKQCVNALRVMLLRLDLYLVSRKVQDYGTVINPEELMFDSFSVSLEKEQAERASALFIQALFSRNLLNKMKALHNPNNKSHKAIVEKLRKINDVVFNVNRRDTTVSKMVWSVFTENPSLVEVCSFKHDLDLVLNVTEWKASTANALPNTWVPLIHATLQCHATSPTLCVMEVNCPFQVYMVRIFDNDSMKEMSRITHSVIPNYYCQNERGYTLLVYGWMEDIRSKEVSWRMQIITNKGNLPLHFCSKAKSTMTCTLTKAPDMGVQEIKDIYIPNRKNLVFRCLLKIKQRALLSFRITPSHNQAKLMVSLKTVDDKLLAQESSESCVVIPAVFVEMNDQLEETTFVLEAIILDDSWPVKHTEFPTVKKIKFKGQQKQNLSEVRRTTRSVIIPKLSRKTLDTSSKRPHDRRTSKSWESTETTQDKPFWHLQVFHGDEHDHIKLSQDNNQKYIFQELKKSWELNDPGRAARGTKLRRRFLIRNYLQKTSLGKTFHSTETLEAGVSTAIIMNLSSNRLQSSSYSSNALVGQDSERHVKTARDREEDLRNLQKKKEEFEFLHARLRRGIEDFSTAQRERHAKAIRLLNESRQESARIMSSAYKIR